MSDPAVPLRPALVKPGDPWSDLEFRAVVDSTNVQLRGAPPWSVLAAEAQESGRGRLDRVWTTTAGASLAVSAVLPHPPKGREGWVTHTVALALRRAIYTESGVETVIKWPNDLLVPADEMRKVSGILAEWTRSGIVVGTGVNVNQIRAELPTETSTSVRLAAGEVVCREAVLTAYLRELATAYRRLDTDPGKVAADYRSASGTLGRAVTVELSGRTVPGTATDIDQNGRLVMTTEDGPLTLAAGDVTHLR